MVTVVGAAVVVVVEGAAGAGAELVGAASPPLQAEASVARATMSGNSHLGHGRCEANADLLITTAYCPP